MTPLDLCYSSATEQARLVRSGELSAREVVGAMLDRIASIDPRLNSYPVVFADQAMNAADEIDLNHDARDLPLLGVPVAVKDDVDVEGAVTAWGTSAQDRVAPTEAPIVAALRDAGAIVVGKTNCSELVVWPFTETAAWGATRNPWNTDFSPGGSSGGSGAAVAAGLCGLALGSDGLGSIRVPTSFTGVVGLNPQHGRVWTTDHDRNGLSSNGPLARTVADAALFLDVASTDGHDGGYRAAIADPPGPLNVALAWMPPARWPMAAKLGDAQRRAVESTAAVLRDLGHTVTEHEVGFPAAAANSYMMRYLTGVAECQALIDRPEAVSSRTRQMARFGRWLDRSRPWAERAATTFAGTILATFETYDIVLTPGAVQRPTRIGELDSRGAVRTLYESGRGIPHFAPWNATGQPAISIPACFSELGIPVSVQLAGRPHDEATLPQLARQLEVAQPWDGRRPLLAA